MRPENPWAFPSGEFGGAEHDKHPLHDGMTLRDYFAGQALVGTLAQLGVAKTAWDTIVPETNAELAYSLADAMLKARA